MLIYYYFNIVRVDKKASLVANIYRNSIVSRNEPIFSLKSEKMTSLDE